MRRSLAFPVLRLAAAAAAATSFSVASSAIVGCSDAADHVASGGELQVTAVVPAAPGPIEHCAPGGGATWSDLYRDCFAPAHAGCGASSDCHADKTHGGGSIWTCGSSAHDCYVGMREKIVILPADQTKPDDSQMFRILRKEPGCPSCMPLGGSFVFAPEDLDRIHKWLADGAQEN